MQHNLMRRIKKAKITHLSLVPRGANRLPVIYKQDATSDNLDIDLLVKEAQGFDERGELLAVVYAPELRDSQGDIASAAVIRDAMHASAKEGLKIDMRHDGKVLSKEQIYVAEQFEIQANDPRFQGFKDRDNQLVDVAGGWGVVLKVDDPALRKLYREKQWGGVSMMGDGDVVIEKSDDEAVVDRVIAKLAGRINKQSNGDFDMDKKELETILDVRDAALTKAITAALVKELKPADPAPVDPVVAAVAGEPILKSDASLSDIRAHRFALRRYRISKSVADAKPTDKDKALETAEKDLEQLEKDVAAEEKKTKPAPTTPEGLSKEHLEAWEEMQERMALLEKSSNQRGSGGDDTVTSGLSKEDDSAVKAAILIAQHRNERMFGKK